MKTTPEAPGNGRFFVLLAVSLLVAASVACSSADPEIMQTDLRIVASYDPVTETFSRRLHVAVDVHDPDGSEDMDLLRVELVRYRLGWERTVDRLTQTTTAGQNWYAVHNLDLPLSGPIGTVRLTVEDKSQRSAEREIVVPPPGDIAIPDLYPILVIDEAVSEGDRGSPRILVPRDSDRVYLMVLEADERFSEPIELDLQGFEPGTEVAIPETVAERLEGRRFYLLVESSRTLWLETGPWSVSSP